MAHVRITQLDGKLPNLALMRLSAWHRANGDTIHFTRSPYRHLDEPVYAHVYGSAIFKFSETRVERFLMEFPEAIIGGTGTNSTATVEAIVPSQFTELDYEIYPEFRSSIGFSSRGCRLSCRFCVVGKKEGKPKAASAVDVIWRGPGFPKHLHLLDNDFFGGPDWRQTIADIRKGNFKVSFTQGINVRAVNDEVAEALASVEYRDDGFTRRRLYTAWDNLKDQSVFFKGIDTLERHGVPPTHVMAYMLIGYDKNETWDRIHHRFNLMVEKGIRPFPMVFDPKRRDLKKFQRWVVTGLYRAVPWEDYDASYKSAGKDNLARQLDLFDTEAALSN